MGCYTSKDISNSVISNNKISHKSKISSKSSKSLKEIRGEFKRDFFNAISKISWINVVDFFSYKDLNQIGQLNK